MSHNEHGRPPLLYLHEAIGSSVAETWYLRPCTFLYRPFHVPRVPNLACVLASFCSFFNTQQRLPSPCSLPRPTRAQVSELWVTPSPTTAFISLDFSQVCRQLICACLVCELYSQQLAPEYRVNSENWLHLILLHHYWVSLLSLIFESYLLTSDHCLRNRCWFVPLKAKEF